MNDREAVMTAEMLKSVPLFSNLSDQELAAVSSISVVRTYPKHSLIINEGDTNDSLFVVLSGKLKVFLSDEEGKEIILDIKGAGDHFGEMALLDEQPRSACLMCLEKSRLMVISADHFKDYLLQNPPAGLMVMGELCQRIRSLNEQVKDLALKNVYERLAKTLTQLAQQDEDELVIADKLTQQDLANMVGSSREMVSRIFNDLVKGGYITREKNRIVINQKLPARW